MKSLSVQLAKIQLMTKIFTFKLITKVHMELGKCKATLLLFQMFRQVSKFILTICLLIHTHITHTHCPLCKLVPQSTFIPVLYWLKPNFSINILPMKVSEGMLFDFTLDLEHPIGEMAKTLSPLPKLMRRARVRS